VCGRLRRWYVLLIRTFFAPGCFTRGRSPWAPMFAGQSLGKEYIGYIKGAGEEGEVGTSPASCSGGRDTKKIQGDQVLTGGHWSGWWSCKCTPARAQSSTDAWSKAPKAVSDAACTSKPEAASECKWRWNRIRRPMMGWGRAAQCSVLIRLAMGTRGAFCCGDEASGRWWYQPRRDPGQLPRLPAS
jgi:hypothetical protein